jgi:hypothetical protein
MRFIVSILLMTLIQLSTFGQLSHWTQGAVIKNKLKLVLVYTKVPKTNPDYYIEPRGLMAISETKFDANGLVTEELCKSCAVRFHSDGAPNADVIQKYSYDKNRLIRIDKTSFDKSTSLFYYDTLKKRRLVIGLGKADERNEVKIEFYNNKNQEIETFEIDFKSIWDEGDSIYQVFLNKSMSTYKEITKTKKEFGYGFGTNLDKKRFKVFKNSFDFDEISKTFESLNYDHLELWNHLTTYYDSEGNELKVIDEKDKKPIREYKRDKNGLIKTERIHFPKYTFEHLYKYKFWNNS